MGNTKMRLTEWSERLAEEAPRIRDESPALAAILTQIADEMRAEAQSPELDAPPPAPFPMYAVDAIRAENDHLRFALHRAGSARTLAAAEVASLEEELNRVYGLVTHLRARVERKKESAVVLDRAIDSSEHRAARRIESIHASLAGIVGVHAETIDEQIDLVRAAVRARVEASDV